jgi:hypothetical protein
MIYDHEKIRVNQNFICLPAILINPENESNEALKSLYL